MLCPVCKIDAVRTKATEVEESGKRYLINQYMCRNKRCTKYKQNIGEEKQELPSTENK